MKTDLIERYAPILCGVDARGCARPAATDGCKQRCEDLLRTFRSTSIPSAQSFW